MLSALILKLLPGTGAVQLSREFLGAVELIGLTITSHLPIPPSPGYPKGEEQNLSCGLMLFPPQSLVWGAPRESFRKLGAPVRGEVWHFLCWLEACLSSILPELLLGLPRTKRG